MSGDMAVKEASPGYELKAANQVIPVGYRKTDIGLIPNDWKHAPLSDLVEKGTRITYGVVQPGKNDPNGVLFIRGGDVYGGRILEDGLRRISETISKDYKRTCLSGGELLISLVGYPGEVALVPSRLAGANIARQVALVKLESSNELSAEYVCSYLRSNFGRNQLLKEAIGSAQQVINLKDVNKVEVVLPASLDEQRAIATALSDVDALLEELDRLIAKKRDIKQATMQQLLTGQTRLPGFEGEWESRSILDIADNQKALFDDGDWVEAEHITDQGIRLVQTGNIGEGTFVEKAARKYIYEASFEKLKCKELKEGDVLICRLAEPAGRACLLPDIGENKIITSVDVTIFRPRPEVADRRFLVQFFSTNDWFKMVLDNVGGTTHKRISRGALGKLKIPSPPLSEQTAIADLLSDMDAEVQALEQRRAKTTALKQAMMQDLLTGRVRLIESNSKD